MLRPIFIAITLCFATSLVFSQDIDQDTLEWLESGQAHAPLNIRPLPSVLHEKDIICDERPPQDQDLRDLFPWKPRPDKPKPDAPDLPSPPDVGPDRPAKPNPVEEDINEVFRPIWKWFKNAFPVIGAGVTAAFYVFSIGFVVAAIILTAAGVLFISKYASALNGEAWLGDILMMPIDLISSIFKRFNTKV